MDQSPESTDDTVTLSVDALLLMARQLGVQLDNARNVVHRLEVALAIAQANPDNETGDRATRRAYGYIEELAALGQLS